MSLLPFSKIEYDTLLNANTNARTAYYYKAVELTEQYIIAIDSEHYFDGSMTYRNTPYGTYEKGIGIYPNWDFYKQYDDIELNNLIASAISTENEVNSYCSSHYIQFNPIATIEAKATATFSKNTPDTFSATSTIEIIPSLTTQVVSPKEISKESTIEFKPSGKLKVQYHISNYNRIDQDFDKVQLLLHFDDSAATKEFREVKGHYPIGLKSTSVEHGAFGEARESVVLLDGTDFGGIEISPNNARNEPSSFNLYQDIQSITRPSNVDWCFECFIASNNISTQSASAAFEHGGYLASNSYSADGVEGIDWGIRLEHGKVVVVLGDIDYSFDVPTGYVFSTWEYLRVYREDNTLGCWLNDNFLGWFEDTPTHEKRHHNYFRIGRAIGKESLLALLDEVRFTIGTARPEQNGLIPAMPFPNIGDFEHRPKITLNAESAFTEIPPNFVSLSLLIPKPKVRIELGLQKNTISSFIKQPKIKISLSKMATFDIYFELRNPVNSPISIIQQGLDLAFSIPAPTPTISLAKEIECDIFGNVPAPLIDILMKVVPEIIIIVPIPDLGTPVGTTAKIDAPIALPALTTSLSIATISGGSGDISFTILKPVFSLNILSYDAKIIDISVFIPKPAFNLIATPPIEIFGVIKQPKIIIGVQPPIADLLSWFDSFLNVTALHVENHIYVGLPSLAQKMRMRRNTELALKVVTPKLKTSLSMALDLNSPNKISIPVTLPTLEIDISHSVMSLSLSINQPIIHIQSLTSSAFL